MRTEDMITGAVISTVVRLGQSQNPELFEALYNAGKQMFELVGEANVVDACDVCDELSAPIAEKFDIDLVAVSDEVYMLGQAIYAIVIG